MQQACADASRPVAIRQERELTWNLPRAQATQSSKVLQRSVSSTSTTFSSCSRAALSLDCRTAQGSLSRAQGANTSVCCGFTSIMGNHTSDGMTWTKCGSVSKGAGGCLL